jgi:hypothetical protein
MRHFFYSAGEIGWYRARAEGRKTLDDIFFEQPANSPKQPGHDGVLGSVSDGQMKFEVD